MEHVRKDDQAKARQGEKAHESSLSEGNEDHALERIDREADTRNRQLKISHIESDERAEN